MGQLTVGLCPTCGQPPILIMRDVYRCDPVLAAPDCPRILIANGNGSFRRPTVDEARRLFEKPNVRQALGLRDRAPDLIEQVDLVGSLRDAVEAARATRSRS